MHSRQAISINFETFLTLLRSKFLLHSILKHGAFNWQKNEIALLDHHFMSQTVGLCKIVELLHIYCYIF